MLFIKRCYSLTQSLSSVQQTIFENASMLSSPKTFDLRFSSSSAPTKQEYEENTPNSEKDRKLKFIQLEISLLHERGGRAPDINLIKQHQWDELLKLETTSARRKFYAFLFSAEKTKENKALKRQHKKETREHQQSLEPPTENSHIAYSLNKTTFLYRIESGQMNLWRNNRLVRAMQFGEKLIFDCSYDQHMTSREAKNAAKQLTLSFAANRKHIEPFDLHFCNVNFNSDTMKQLERYIPVMRNKEFPLNLHEQSYLDLFPKDQLIYLTPHCQDDLTEYDPDMIYIIGAMVDKMNQEPLSLAKAKELNLKMARLPLDKHLQWGSGSGKSLTLDQMTRIMLDLKKTRDWQVALKHVPRRKVKIDHDNLRPNYAFLNQTKKFS